MSDGKPDSTFPGIASEKRTGGADLIRAARFLVPDDYMRQAALRFLLICCMRESRFQKMTL
jgi:hypothetical protein